MEKGILRLNTLPEEVRFIALSLAGAALIALGSWIRIPFYPVPFTLQTLSIFILGLALVPKQAFASGLAYLLCASVGLPVLDGSINCLWMTGKCGGYLLSFPIAAYTIAKLRQKFPPFFALIVGEAIILLCGASWLIPFIGVKGAFMKGALLFIPSALLKAAAALSLHKWRNR